MTLLDIYTGWCGLEVISFIIALVLIIAPLFSIWDLRITFKQKAITWGSMVLIGIILILINISIIPNNTYYDYYVTDMSQLQQMVDQEGYVVVDNSENQIYTIRKGE
jgi:membrane protein YdbS with pleckstrin-like domain